MDPFATLGIPALFALDPTLVERRQRESFVALQGQGPTALEFVNMAVRLLKDPVTRAEQLFALRGWTTRGRSEPEQLERVFADRELIDRARRDRDLATLNRWLSDAKPRRASLLESLTRLLDDPASPQDAERAATAQYELEALRYLAKAMMAAHAAVEALESIEE